MSNTEDIILAEYEEQLAAAVVPDYFLSSQFCNGGTQTTDYVIPPATSEDPAAASLATGAPPLQQVKPSLGGAVFPRQQYNGILRLLSNLLAYLNKGNNFTFDTKNTSGYALGAVLFDYNSNKWVVSLKNANTNNFVTNPTLIDGVNWQFITVNPTGSNNFTVSPTVPTPALNDSSKKAINSEFMLANTANATKYNYPISCKNTPTFTAGEEYILALPAFDGEAQYQLVFKGGYQAGAGQYGSINIDLSIIFNGANSYQRWGIVINSITQANGIVIPQSQLNELFTFTAYNTTPVVINGASISGVVLAIKLNSALPYTGTKNSLTGLFSTNNIINYTNGANPNNAALLGITNGALTLATEGAIDEEGLQASTVLTPSFMVGTNVPNMTNNNLIKWLNGIAQDSGIASNNIGLLSANNSWSGDNAFTKSPTVPTPTKGSSDSKVANMAALSAGLADKQNTLGFTPVQQGGGAGQLTNKVYVGWGWDGLKAQVDSTDLGVFAFRDWVNGNFATISALTANGGGIIASGVNVRGGWVRFYNGLKICWGGASSPSDQDPYNVLLPTSFDYPPAVVGCNASNRAATTSAVYGVTTYYFTMRYTTDLLYIALGY